MKNQSKETVTLCAVGDVCVNRQEPGSIFAFTMPTISQADIAFCQLETLFSERGCPVPQARVPLRSEPDNVSALKYAGFDVVSLAGNHCLDYGAEAFFDTIDNVKKAGLLTLGVGKNIDEARRPVIVERKGIKVGFLAYNSILPAGYWADDDRPGCCPLRVHTLYEQIEPDQPGTRCRIRTFPMRDDFEAMKRDIAALKADADIVIVSLHWGLHFVPAEIAEYQREVGHAAIDSGADLIVGHHAHILKGVEVYKGKVIFYSLCNFAFDQRHYKATPEDEARRLRLNSTWKYDPEYAAYMFPADSRKTILVKSFIAGKHIAKVSFLPVFINGQAQPQILTRNDKRFGEVVDYMKEITIQQGLATKYTIDGDEVIVS